MTFAADGSNLDVLSLPRPTWGPLASLGLHGALLAMLLLNAAAPRPHPPETRSIVVDLISAAQFAALQAPKAIPTPEPSRPVVAPDVVEPPKTRTIRATHFYAGEVLADLQNARVRRAMPTLAPSERLVQLCDLEAMEQIQQARPEFDPDIVVAYAMADTMVRDGALVADGAAFRSRREWYEVHFRCRAAADFSRVEAFDFSVGSFIPHEMWEAHDLTAEEVE